MTKCLTFPYWTVSIMLLLLVSILCSESDPDQHPYQVIQTESPNSSNQSSLLVILIDGMRWDVLSHVWNSPNRKLSGFNRLRKTGAYVERFAPVFPAECFPNIYSLFTGVHPRDHGILFNVMFNNETDESYHFSSNGTNNDAISKLVKVESLWETAHNQNKSMHLYHLPTCSPNDSARWHCVPYDQSKMNAMGLQDTLTKALDALKRGSADLAVVYYDELDRLGHMYGPTSDPILQDSLPQLDQVLSEAMDQIETIPNLHLILTSDHGMARITRRTYLDRFIKSSHVKKVLNRGSTVSIWPHPDKHQKLLDRLRLQKSADQFTVHDKSDLPEDWQTGGPLFPPVLLLAQSGLIFESYLWPPEFNRYNSTHRVGLHGYDPHNVDMHIPLLVWGPSIRPGSSIQGDQIKPTDLHQLITKLGQLGPADPQSIRPFEPIFHDSLDLEVKPPHNQAALHLFLSSGSLLTQTNMLVVLVVGLLILLCLVLVGLYCHYKLVGCMNLENRLCCESTSSPDLKRKLVQSDYCDHDYVDNENSRAIHSHSITPMA